MKLHRQNTINFFLHILISFILLTTYSCGGESTEIAIKSPKRETIPVLKAKNVSTIISDSGIIRFKITTPQWLVYDKAKEPYWKFPIGIKFDRFTQGGKIEAKMQADRAIYIESKYLWRFDGNVLVKNLNGEIFETEQLFWDDANRKFYSDKNIKITQKNKIIKGIGFESNSTLTRYIIRKPTGIIPVDSSN